MRTFSCLLLSMALSLAVSRATTITSGNVYVGGLRDIDYRAWGRFFSVHLFSPGFDLSGASGDTNNQVRPGHIVDGLAFAATKADLERVHEWPEDESYYLTVGGVTRENCYGGGSLSFTAAPVPLPTDLPVFGPDDVPYQVYFSLTTPFRMSGGVNVHCPGMAPVGWGVEGSGLATIGVAYGLSNILGWEEPSYWVWMSSFDFAQDVPEPSTVVLLGGWILALAALRRVLGRRPRDDGISRRRSRESCSVISCVGTWSTVFRREEEA